MTLMGLSEAAVDELVAALPAGVVVTDADGVEKYRFDWSRDPSAGTPRAVIMLSGAGRTMMAG